MLIKELTEQEVIWRSHFGEEYNKRNTYTNEELDNVFRKVMGISRTEINKEFINDLDRESKILEIGCNIGMMLVNLQEMGFRNLHGIEIQSKALEIARKRSVNIEYTEGSAYSLPFDNNEFDMIFTCHVLIHLPPDRIRKALQEINRCCRKFIYCEEYYADEIMEIKNYHGKNNIVWKRNFEKLFSDEFKELKLIKSSKYKYTENENIETVFLLSK